MIDDPYRHLGSATSRGPSTVDHFQRLLRFDFNQGMKWGLLTTNPAKLATPPRVPHHEIVPPSVEDVRAVLKQAAEVAPVQALWFRMLVATGCRRSEVSGMRWADLNLGSGKVSVRNAVVQVGSDLVEKDTTTHQQRTVTLDRGVVAALRRHHDACVLRVRRSASRCHRRHSFSPTRQTGLRPSHARSRRTSGGDSRRPFRVVARAGRGLRAGVVRGPGCRRYVSACQARSLATDGF